MLYFIIIARRTSADRVTGDPTEAKFVEANFLVLLSSRQFSSRQFSDISVDGATIGPKGYNSYNVYFSFHLLAKFEGLVKWDTYYFDNMGYPVFVKNGYPISPK